MLKHLIHGPGEGGLRDSNVTEPNRTPETWLFWQKGPNPELKPKLKNRNLNVFGRTEPNPSYRKNLSLDRKSSYKFAIK